MKARAVCFVGLIWITATIPAQLTAQHELIVSGIILDAQTLEPLPYAHIVRNSQSATTPDLSGNFVVRLNKLDTLTISHVSYISQNLLIGNDQESDTIILAVFLESEVTMLPDLEVTPFPTTVEDFKQRVMELDVKDPVRFYREQQPAITYDIIMGPKVSYDSYENYRRINHPTDITFFSTGPSKGIRKLLRNLGISKRRKP